MRTIDDHFQSLRLCCPMADSPNPDPLNEKAPDNDGELKAVEAQFRAGDLIGALAGFERLAELGSAPAMTWLGYMYLYGKGVVVDTAIAFDWFSKAAQAEDAEAMTWIGYIYFSGIGVPTDEAAALQWYLKASEAGDAEGQHRLAWMLEKVGQLEEAECWIRKAAGQGYSASVRWVRGRSAYDLLCAKRYDEALAILKTLSDEGSAWAHERLGWMYWHGHGVRKDTDQSIQHYEAAYDGGQVSAANVLGGLYFRKGRPETALLWWRKATENPISILYWQYRVTKTHSQLEAYPGESDALLIEAADAGHVIAKRDIALRMMKGQRSFGTRLEGLRAWFKVFPYAIRIVMNDEHDERLQ